MRFSIRSVIFACLAVALFMTMLPHYLEWRRLKVRFQNSQNSVWRITSLGGRVEEFGMSKIPAAFFLRNSENSIVPESMKDIEITGVLTSAHDLGRLPESVERLWLTLTSDAIPNIPKFESVRSLRIVLISETGNPRISSDAAALLRSKFTTRLSTLSLFGSAMSDEVVHQFRDCKTLETLHVGGEGFTGYGFAQWPVQKALTHCDVAGKIENKHMLQFPALPNATFLEICSETHLSGGLNWLRNCPKISHLTLAGTGVEPVGFQEVAKLPELSTLRLRALKNIDFSALAGMVQLNRLELDRCEITDGDFSTWPSSTSVSRLSLRNTDFALASLSKIPGLRSLDLDTHLKYQDLVESGLPVNLQIFIGDYVEVSNAQLEQLKTLFPTVEFRVPDELVNRVPVEERRYIDSFQKWLRK